MHRASQAYDALRHQLEHKREENEKQREEINHQRVRIDLLEAALAHAKNEASEYRVMADEAKAETAGWKAFFANLRGVINQYDIPSGAPIRKQPVKIDVEEVFDDKPADGGDDA